MDPSSLLDFYLSLFLPNGVPGEAAGGTNNDHLGGVNPPTARIPLNFNTILHHLRHESEHTTPELTETQQWAVAAASIWYRKAQALRNDVGAINPDKLRNLMACWSSQEVERCFHDKPWACCKCLQLIGADRPCVNTGTPPMWYVTKETAVEPLRTEKEEQEPLVQATTDLESPVVMIGYTCQRGIVTLSATTGFTQRYASAAAIAAEVEKHAVLPEHVLARLSKDAPLFVEELLTCCVYGDPRRDSFVAQEVVVRVVLDPENTCEYFHMELVMEDSPPWQRSNKRGGHEATQCWL